MRVLLDTHTFLWWLDADPALPGRAHAVISDGRTNQVFVSAASAWEITTKHRIGKLPGAAAVAADVSGAIRRQGFLPLSVSVHHAQRAGCLPGWHRDPFDRMLIAQTLDEGLVLISNEILFDRYGVPRLW